MEGRRRAVRVLSLSTDEGVLEEKKKEKDEEIVVDHHPHQDHAVEKR